MKEKEKNPYLNKETLSYLAGDNCIFPVIVNIFNVSSKVIRFLKA